MIYHWKKIILVVGLLSCERSAMAQLEAGITAGYVKNHIITSPGYRTFTRYQDRSSVTAGLVFRYRLNQWLAVEADPSYLQKRYELRRYNFFDGIHQINTNGYLLLPVMGHFSFGGEKLKGFVNMGGYGGWWMHGRIKGTMPNVFSEEPGSDELPGLLVSDPPYDYNEKYAFDRRRDRRIEWGLLAGAGLEYRLQNRFVFFAEARYYYSLTDQQKKYMLNQVPQYLDAYVLQAGCLFRFQDIFRKPVQ